MQAVSTRWAMLGVVASTLVMACYDNQRAEDDAVCDPGETQTCVCAGALEGAQVCASNGESWSACDCGGATGQGGEAGGAAVMLPTCTSGATQTVTVGYDEALDLDTGFAAFSSMPPTGPGDILFEWDMPLLPIWLDDGAEIGFAPAPYDDVTWCAAQIPMSPPANPDYMGSSSTIVVRTSAGGLFKVLPHDNGSGINDVDFAPIDPPPGGGPCTDVFTTAEGATIDFQQTGACTLNFDGVEAPCTWAMHGDQVCMNGGIEVCGRFASDCSWLLYGGLFFVADS